MNVSYTMFNNYHNAAKEFSNGDMTVYGRLMFIVNTYAIEGVIVEDLSPVEKLFLTSIQASIDKSIRLSEAGRKGGSKGVSHNDTETVPEEQETATSEASFSDANNEACKPFEMACNEEEEEIEQELRIMNKEKETEQNKKGNVPDSSVLFGSVLTSTQKIVFDWISEKNLSLQGKNKHYLYNISDFLDENKLGVDFLNHVFGIVEAEYEKVNLGILFHAFSWETTVSSYEVIQKQKNKALKAKAPKKCTVCGSGLVERLPGTVECPECRRKGNPIWWELDTNKNRWVCSL